jgi:hypothetical protein
VEDKATYIMGSRARQPAHILLATTVWHRDALSTRDITEERIDGGVRKTLPVGVAQKEEGGK